MLLGDDDDDDDMEEGANAVVEKHGKNDDDDNDDDDEEEEEEEEEEDGDVVVDEVAVQVSKLIHEMELSELVGLRVYTLFNGMNFLGTITNHLDLLEGHQFRISYDDGDIEDFTEKGGGKYIKNIEQLKRFIVAAYTSKKGDGDVRDLSRPTGRSRKRQKTKDDTAFHYGGVTEC